MRTARARQRVAAFRDRTSETRRILAAVEHAARDAEHQMVFEVTGFGGAGKSRFLDELARRAAAPAVGARVAMVSLDLEAELTSVAPLLTVRNALPIESWLFDTALLTYWAATGQPRGVLGGDDASDIVRLAPPFAPVPPGFGALVARELPLDTMRRGEYTSSMFAEIDDLRAEPEALRARLPELAGRDVHAHRRNGNVGALLFLYDGYERQAAETVADAAPWLRAFVDACATGVHVIATRLSLGWPSGRWGAVDEVLLGPLPDPECRRLIRRELGEMRRDVETGLIEASEGLAFYLHASIGVVRDHLDEHDVVEVADLPATQSDAVERMLDHLGPVERQLAIALAAVQQFDAALYAYLVHQHQLDGCVGMHDFVEWFFVAKVDDGLHRTHDLLTQSVRASVDRRDLVSRALELATIQVATRADLSGGRAEPHLVRLFHSLVEGWASLPAMPVTAAERLVDIGYVLYDAGSWDELLDLPEPATTPTNATGLVTSYFKSLTARRREGTEPAIELLEQHQSEVRLLGRHAVSFEIERAYLHELAGDYRTARETFRALAAAEPFDPTNRSHIRFRLYHADMLTMDGELVAADQVLAATLNALDDCTARMWAELMRHRAHVHRFALDHARADAMYVEVLGTRPEPAMTAKLLTNRAETLCWSDPVLGREFAAQAEEANAQLGNVIERAKVGAARAVALARLGELTEADAACARALQLAQDAQYPAGACFAHQARVVVAVARGDGAAASDAFADLLAGVTELGTYGHLCVVPAWLRQDEDELRRRAAAVDWLRPDELGDRLAALSPG